MTAPDEAAPMVARAARPKAWLAICLIATAVVVLLVLANAHLVYVATTSQPDCVPHLKTSGEATGSFRAATPAC